MRRELILLMCIGAAAGCLVDGRDLAPSVARAEAYATAFPFSDLVIEIDFAPGREPSALALDGLRQILASATDKREVRVLPPTPLPDEARFRSADADWSGRHRDVHVEQFDSFDGGPGRYGRGDAAYVHVLYLNGRIDNNGSVTTGIHTEYGISIYVDDMRNPPPTRATADQLLMLTAPDEIERAVLVHEFGHLLGLVDAGARMVRPHSDGQGHSTSAQSVMYGGVHATQLARENKEVVWTFDEDDLADLRQLQAEARERYPR